MKMKIMKKIISLILVLTMVMALAVSASATGATEIFTSRTPLQGSEKTWSATNTATGEVKVTVTTATNPVYKVDINWDNLSFTYDINAGVWNPDNHSYNDADKGWGTQSGTLTITNHSNDAIHYVASIDNKNNTGSAKVKFTAGSVEDDIATADTGTSLGVVENAPKAKLTYAPYGTPDSATAANTVFAAINVVITVA